MPFSFQTQGYEDMELSTQVVLAEALRRGVSIEILDRKENFIRLTRDGHTELVKDATRTSKDSYITSLVLGNKSVSKILLEEVGIRVPKGAAYDTRQAALLGMDLFVGRKIVVKPKTTNFGIGIGILEPEFAPVDYEKAVGDAFEHDRSIVVEEFLEGIECRFLVVAGKCVAVLHRVPANVVGDGQSSVQDLVAIKNQDPRRGVGHITPLEKIQLSEAELGVLSKQGLTPSSVPAEGQRIFLRENSNISTGGDSLDYTHKVHDQYLRIAERAAEAASAHICGVDVILENPNEEPTSENHGIIEINFNPVLYFHDFPYEGENHHVENAVLDLLGFPSL